MTKRWLAFMVFVGAIAWASSEAADAHADPESQFNLTTGQVMFADSGAGMGICDRLDRDGGGLSSVMDTVQATSSIGGYDLMSSARIVNYSVYTYCYRWWPNLVALGDSSRLRAQQQQEPQQIVPGRVA